jgi:hypothetical protein
MPSEDSLRRSHPHYYLCDGAYNASVTVRPRCPLAHSISWKATLVSASTSIAAALYLKEPPGMVSAQERPKRIHTKEPIICAFENIEDHDLKGDISKSDLGKHGLQFSHSEGDYRRGYAI